MPLTTTPDGLSFPNSGESYNLISQVQTLVNAIQNTLTKRANYYSGTTSDREANVSSVPEGSVWYDTDTTYEYRNISNAWVRIPKISVGDTLPASGEEDDIFILTP